MHRKWEASPLLCHFNMLLIYEGYTYEQALNGTTFRGVSAPTRHKRRRSYFHLAVHKYRNTPFYTYCRIWNALQNAFYNEIQRCNFISGEEGPAVPALSASCQIIIPCSGAFSWSLKVRRTCLVSHSVLSAVRYKKAQAVSHWLPTAMARVRDRR
jgi:hypothetical protein